MIEYALLTSESFIASLNEGLYWVTHNLSSVPISWLIGGAVLLLLILRFLFK